MATKIRLMRLGKIRAPHYRIVVADSRTKRDGKVIETIGKYHPKEDPSLIEVDSDRARYWLSVGAQPTEPVLALLKLTGDWQHSKGKDVPSRVRVAAPKPDHKARYEAEAAKALELKVEKDKVEKAEKAEKKAAKKAKADDAGDKAAKPAKASADKADKADKEPKATGSVAVEPAAAPAKADNAADTSSES